MKRSYVAALTTFLTLCIFSAILYSSCTKDSCKGVVCENGGTCANGSCVCPTGYTGVHCEVSIIVYTNDTYTPISITVNEETHVIGPGSYVSYYGTAGSNAVVTAYTSATDATGKATGEKVTWSFTDQFPTNGARLNHPLDVSSDYYYLKVANGDYYDSVVALQVYYGTTNQVTDSVALPNNGLTYVIGYYKTQQNGQILAIGKGINPVSSWVLTPQVPNTLNATATVSVP